MQYPEDAVGPTSIKAIKKICHLALFVLFAARLMIYASKLQLRLKWPLQKGQLSGWIFHTSPSPGAVSEAKSGSHSAELWRDARAFVFMLSPFIKLPINNKHTIVTMLIFLSFQLHLKNDPRLPHTKEWAFIFFHFLNLYHHFTNMLVFHSCCSMCFIVTLLLWQYYYFGTNASVHFYKITG